MNALNVSRTLALSLALLAAGCLHAPRAQQQAAAQRRTFAPQAVPGARLAEAPRFAAVKLRGFRCLPPFDSRPLIVRRPGGEVAADFYNSWVAAPHDLLRAQTARHLERTGLFTALYDAASGTLPPLGLEGVVGELALDYTGARPAAALTLRLLVLDERAPDFAVLFSCERSARVPFDPGPADAGVRALNEALSNVLEALGRDLADAPLPQPPHGSALPHATPRHP